MHLRTLTMRGFKSFASPTTFTFEPGITCVVGPNGSGKSNVVDALAWVMGEQGAKSLRGAAMADVIFAGTTGRPPLGRAEVSLTIDNTDGALPIDYAEVTVARTLFRHGGSEYAINGTPCRLLDVQDLLSDSGIGREMHVIVGQGRLESVLRATPEERRGFIEEAAGVLKHRKRKEKALRKLDAMAANLQRLADLTAEVGRQLGPLGRQASVARRAASIQSEVRDSRARLLADDLAVLLAGMAETSADEEALAAQRADIEQRLAAGRKELVEAELEQTARATDLAALSDVWYRLMAVRERLRGIHTLASERLRLLSAPEPPYRGPDPDELADQGARAEELERELHADADDARALLEETIAHRQHCEQAADRAEREVAELTRSAADRREALVRLTGQLEAQHSRLEVAQAQVGRLREALGDAEQRGGTASTEFSAMESQVAGLAPGDEDLAAAHEEAVRQVAVCAGEVDRLAAEERTAASAYAAACARIDALDLALDRKDGAGALLAAGLPGTLGSLAALLAVDPGYEDAVAGVLGAEADAVVVDAMATAIAAIRHLRAHDNGQASVVVAGSPPDASYVQAPAQGVWAKNVVRAADHVHGLVELLFADVVIVDSLGQARRVVAQNPGLRAVTRSGDVLAVRGVRGGSASAPSVLHLQAAVDEAREARDRAQGAGERATSALAAARSQATEAQERADQMLRQMHESDAAMAAVGEQLGRLGEAARSAAAEAERHRRHLLDAEEALDADRGRLADLLERHEFAQAAAETELDAEDAIAVRDEAAAAATTARAAEMEARLALRTAEERARAIAGRAETLARNASEERAAREDAARRAHRRAALARRAAEVADVAARMLRVAEESTARAGGEREIAQEVGARRDAEITELRAEVDRWTDRLRDLTDAAHRDEIARAEQRLRRDQLHERALVELSLEPAALIEEFGPHCMVPDGEGGEVPFDREVQVKRLKLAERDLSRLGKVNPLALEEFAAVEERHAFLSAQLADLKKSRADLMEIVREIDDRVERVFAEAFADTAVQFERVFTRMFPGGEGRLVLTDPDQMLSTGIEVEARPAGKKVKRLSLLSGGERSLTAIALLVAIFKARPSPFYVMDEVEAALDDVNLGRLLEVFRELRADSQLLVITHQKRTMEVADALYGITMQGDGVSTVISQRLADVASG